MDLSEIREKFRDLTGRYDLVTPNNTDEGADFYINAGQRWLDRQLDFQGASAETTLSLSTGAYSADVTDLRAVKSVAVGQGGQDFAFLDKREYRPLRAYIENQQNSDQGQPRYYAIGRRAPGGRSVGSEELYFWPPTDGTYTAIVEGLFSSTVLSNNTDESFWSANFPDILIKAAAFRMEAMQRNTQGESDYRQSLQEDLENIDHDEVEEAIAGIDRVNNTWLDINL